MRTPHHLPWRSIPKRPCHRQLLEILITLLIPLKVIAVLDPKVAETAKGAIVPRRDKKRHRCYAAEGAATVVPVGGDVVLDVHDFPVGHLVAGVEEGAVVHLGDLGGSGRCGPGEPEDALDLGGGEWEDGEEVYQFGIG